MRISWLAGLLIAMLVTREEPAKLVSTHRPLPPPALSGPMSFEETIKQRRSTREFTGELLSLAEIGQLCWAGQGMTDQKAKLRAVPSAGALYPIELYVVIADEISHYLPREHSLECHLKGDYRERLRRAALDQEVVGKTPVCMVITAIVERTAGKYRDRAERYCFIEAGHVAQNILLQATALRLGGVPVGAFNDEGVAEALKLPKSHRVVYLLPIGHRRR